MKPKTAGVLASNVEVKGAEGRLLKQNSSIPNDRNTSARLPVGAKMAAVRNSAAALSPATPSERRPLRRP